MIDTEELPPPSLAVKLGDEVTCSALCRLHEIGKSVKPSKWGDISLLAHQSAAVAAGYVAGVRHERKRQRQKLQQESSQRPRTSQDRSWNCCRRGE